jgi:uncharacterized protein
VLVRLRTRRQLFNLATQRSEAGPVMAGERIPFVDVLRGMAMLFILVENLAIYSGQRWDPALLTQPAERATLVAILFLLQAKSYSLLAFLFGWGVAVQQERIESRDGPFVPFYLRRLGFLLAVGLLHGTLIWSGDVLLVYAVIGLFLLAFRRASPRLVLIAAVACLSITILLQAPGAAMDAARGWYAGATDSMRAEPVPAAVYATGPFGDIMRRRIHDLVAGYSWAPYYAGTMLGMFLLGMYAARRRWLHRIDSHLRPMRQVMWLSLGLGLTLNELFVEAHLDHLDLSRAWNHFLEVGARTTGAVALVTFYVAAVAVLTQRDGVRRRLQPLANVGRCSLSNYLLQSLACTAIFYRYGLGLYGDVGIVFGTALALLLYLGQLRLTAWWLEQYPLGPVEWLWRVVSYGYIRCTPILARVWMRLRQAAVRVDRRVWYSGAALLLLAGIGFGAWQIRTRPIEAIVEARKPIGRAAATPASGATATPTPIATPVVQPVAYLPGPIAEQRDLGALAATFDAASALAEIQVLTGPPYLGRYPGSSGGRAAGEYIARRFAEYRLQPAGDGATYYQFFPIEYVSLTEDPALSVRTADGLRTRFEPYRDFSPIASQYAGAGEASGELVWGSRCTAEELNATDVLDKVLLCRDGPVLDLQRSALEHGAAGLLLMTDPARRPPDFGATFGEAWVPEPLVALRVYPSTVEAMLAGSDYSVDDLSTSFVPTLLGVQVEAHVSTLGAEACPTSGCRGRNILGVLPGRDPVHRNEVVIVGAHYDHLGEAPGGTAWVGANDDASGVAALLEIARAWAAQGYVPRRTVLFAAWDAEEMGLLGSRYYVDHPRYPLGDTLGMLQLDMVGAGGELLQIDGDSAMAARLRAIAEAGGLDTLVTRDGRSDHVPFWEASIPAGMLIWDTSLQAGAQPIYHRPSDTVGTIELGKLQAAGQIGDIALLGLAEGELDIADLLATRAAAAEAGDLGAFLDTSASTQRQDDRYWYADLASLRPTSVQMTARDIHVTGAAATASVRIVVSCPDGSGEGERTLTASLDARFEHEGGTWRWAGPDLVEQGALDGEFTVSYPAGLGQDVDGLGGAAAARYAHIAARLGLPTKAHPQIMLLPNSEALQASTAVGGSFEDEMWVGSDSVRMVYSKEISGSVRLDKALVQLALAEAGVRPESAPWLWEGLPPVMGPELGRAEPRFLGEIQDQLRTTPDTESEALAWAAVTYLRDQAGWPGIGRFIVALGQTCGGAPCGEHEVDAALATVLDLGGIGFADAWHAYWAGELERVQGALDQLLSARADAIVAGDERAFLASVDPLVPGLVDEQAAWFRDASALGPASAQLDGRLLTVAGDRLLALVNARYEWDASAAMGGPPGLDLQTVVELTPAPHGYVWSGPPSESLSSGPVTLLFPSDMASRARPLLDQIAALHSELVSDLSITDLQPFVVRIHDEGEAFRSAVPPSVAGSGKISAWSERDAPLQLLVSANAKDYGSMLCVELARYLLQQQGVDAGWLLEGMSLYLASRLDRSVAQSMASQLPDVLEAVQEDSLPELWSAAAEHAPANERTPSKEDPQLDQAHAWDVVRYVADRYGRAALAALVRAVGRGMDADAALQSAIGIGAGELSREWAVSLARGHATQEWEGIAAQFDPDRAYADVAYLAGDELQGRQAGSVGAAQAATYIASRFAAYGLQPAVVVEGGPSFEETFPISYTTLLEAPALELVGDDGKGVEALTSRADFLLYEASGSGDAEGQAVWIADPEYAGLDLGGKVAVRAPSLPVADEVAHAMEHGASALLLVGKTSGQMRALAKPALPITFPGSASIPVLDLTQQGYALLLAAAGRSEQELGDALPATPLGIRVRMRIPLQAPRTVEAFNVLGVLPGADPSLADEVVLVSAGYDHVGDDPPAWVCHAGVYSILGLDSATSTREAACVREPGRRYPGANDNASGVAVMLEVARLWHEAGYCPARTVLFAAWAGHEVGEAGLQWYMQAPVLPLGNTVAALHLEAVGGGQGYYLGVEGSREQDGLLRFTMERAEELLDGRLSISSPPAAGDPAAPYRQAGIPTLYLRWREASAENWPVELADEVQPYRLGVTGRTVALALMALAR